MHADLCFLSAWELAGRHHVLASRRRQCKPVSRRHCLHWSKPLAPRCGAKPPPAVNPSIHTYTLTNSLVLLLFASGYFFTHMFVTNIILYHFFLVTQVNFAYQSQNMAKYDTKRDFRTHPPLVRQGNSKMFNKKQILFTSSIYLR